MTASHSNGRSSSTKPQKPYAGFPLCWHPSGYWVKKIRGRVRYFGSRHASPEQALAEYLRVRDDLHAGREPRADVDSLTVKDLANHFLTSRESKLKTGELVERTFLEYRGMCERVLNAFGKNRLVTDLGPEDFQSLRNEIAKTWNSNSLCSAIQKIRTLFKYGHDVGLLPTPMRFGPAFVKPSQKTLRIERANKGLRLFEADQIRRLLAVADDQLKLMILLGVGAGLGNTDLGALSIDALDLAGGWLNYARRKTGVPRRCPLWPETIEAIRIVIANRKPPEDKRYRDLLFLSRGLPWCEYPRDLIAWTFRKHLRALGLYRAGAGFYGLRHTFQTIGDECRDPIATSYLMGHIDGSISGAYRERISDERLKSVSEYVRQWLFGVEPKKPEVTSPVLTADERQLLTIMRKSFPRPVLIISLERRLEIKIDRQMLQSLAERELLRKESRSGYWSITSLGCFAVGEA